jgi:hypothetical protein
LKIKTSRIDLTWINRIKLIYLCCAFLTLKLYPHEPLSAEIARCASHLINITYPKPSDWQSYIFPNELRPSDLESHLRDIPEGAYITTGSERALFAAVVSPKITNVIVIDSDPAIIKFHKINTELLKSANSMENYFFLRVKATFSDWQKAHLTLTQEDWDFWENQVRNNSDAFVMHNKPLMVSYHTQELTKVNYLFNEAAFNRVQSLARSNKLHFILGKLEDERLMKNIILTLRKYNAEVSAVDFSNTWHSNYITPPNLNRILKLLINELDTRARVIFTHNLGTASLAKISNLTLPFNSHAQYFSFTSTAVNEDVLLFLATLIDKNHLMPFRNHGLSQLPY